MISNWKTTAIGLAAAVFIAAGQSYHQGMNLKQWAIAAGTPILVALLGFASKDHDK
jgi:hypothetical protein